MHTFLLVVTYRYYRESLGALIVYDITSRPSFEHVEGWLNDLIQHASSDIVIILVRCFAFLVNTGGKQEGSSQPT